MSMGLGGVADSVTVMWFDMDEERAREPRDQWNVWHRSAQLQPWADALLWPNSRLAAGDQTAGVGYLVGQDANNGSRWEHPSRFFDESGSQSALKIRGITRDSSGNPLGSVTVQGFVNATDQYVSQCVSDGGGYYELCTQYAGLAHYLVAYKPGSPDVSGTTVNTLMPS